MPKRWVSFFCHAYSLYFGESANSGWVLALMSLSVSFGGVMNEIIWVFLGLALLGWLFLGPVAALVRAARVRDEMSELKARLTLLEVELREYKLRHQEKAMADSTAALVSEPAAAFCTVPSIPPPLPTMLPGVEVLPGPVVKPMNDRSDEGEMEQFLGARLFAWLGGLALFLGVVFFVKYAFERDLISPALRVGIGFLCGLGLISAGVMGRKKQAYGVLTQTLMATGVLIWYGSAYAGNALYALPGFSQAGTFLCMSAITVVAFVLAVRLEGPVIALLGMVGGFLTPWLLGTGVDKPVALFSYITLLDVGLLAVVMRRGWGYLVPCAAAGTLVMEVGWFLEFFWKGGYSQGQGIGLMTAVFLFFPVLFTGVAVRQRRASWPVGLGWQFWLSAWVLLGWAYLAAHLFLDVPALRETPHLALGMGVALAVLLLVLAEAWRLSLGAVFAALGMALLALHWVDAGPVLVRPWSVVPWALMSMGGLGVYAFVRRSEWQPVQVWAASALVWVAFYPAAHLLVTKVWPNEWMGLLPAAFAVPALLGLVGVARRVEADAAARDARMAWFGGVALFFLALIFPVQFERQWITLGWALEGAALCWLSTRVRHDGLRRVGFGMLVSVFLRLAVNPAVLTYHERSGTPVWNWFLYTYGLAALAMFAAARWLAPPRDRLGDLNLRALLWAFGGILLFLLVNIEIADAFTKPGQRFISTHFGGDFARSMTFSIAWALYALGLLVIGLWRRVKGARYAGIALLGFTLMKLFLHDLANIGSLYRIAAFLAVAMVALGASFLYQRFSVRGDFKDEG